MTPGEQYLNDMRERERTRALTRGEFIAGLIVFFIVIGCILFGAIVYGTI